MAIAPKPLAKWVQTPTERKRYSIDYSQWLDVGETVVSAALVATPSVGFVVTTAVVADDGLSVAFFVSGGSADVVYKLLVTMATSGNQIKEDSILFTIELP